MRRTSPRRRLLVAGLVLAMIAPASIAFGHAEREAFFPDGTGKVPKYRPMIAEPNLVVCASDSRERIM